MPRKTAKLEDGRFKYTVSINSGRNKLQLNITETFLSGLEVEEEDTIIFEYTGNKSFIAYVEE